MVASNSGESRNRNTRGMSEGRERVNNYRNGEKRENKPFKKDFKDKENGERTRRNSQDGNRGFKDARNGGNQKKDGYKAGDNGNKPFKKKFNDRNGYMNAYDKDDDEVVRPQKRQASSKEGKAKEQQPDKIEIMNRIEKEKKAMQKKQAERKNSKPVRMQNRPNRTNNIDWTREYENGSYDDDDLDMYL